MNETAVLIFMVIASTYFMAKLIFLVVENTRRQNAKSQFSEFLAKFEQQFNKKDKK